MKKDIYDFLKAHNITELIKESIREGKRKEITITEEDFLQNITSKEYFESRNKELEEAYCNRDVKGFSLRIKERERKYKRKRLIRTFALSTTTTAALLIISFYLLKNENKPLLVAELEKVTRVDKEFDVPVLITPNYEIKLAGEQKSDPMEKLFFEEDSVFIQRLVVPKGFTYTTILSDSTEVTINAGSELSYASRFIGANREVTLKGEAYFKVKKSSKPFIVTTEDISIKVYGTQFNVNSYDAEKVQTLLVSGSVGVTYKKNREEVLLKPSQMATVDQQGKIDLSDVSVEKYIAWLKGEIINDNEPLTLFLETIERWYNIEFIFSDDVGKINISAEIKNSRPLDEVLKSIEIISGVKITKLKENKYMIEK